MSFLDRVSLDSSGGPTEGAYAVFPGRPYVVRGWLSSGTWAGLTVTVSTAEPTAYPVATPPFFLAASKVPITASPFSDSFEFTFVTAGQCIVVTMTGATGQILNLGISAITSHE